MMSALFLAGCSKGSGSNWSPLVPTDEQTKRQAMAFDNPQTLFGGGEILAADVDLASVVWGQTSAGTGSGEIVVFDDTTSWAVAVAIQDDPNNESLPSQPWVRFLDQNNNPQLGEFAVGSLWLLPSPHELARVCRLPKVDCTYLGDGQLEVVVAFRYGLDQADCGGIATWDVKVTKMHFSYSTGGGWEESANQDIMDGADMAYPGTGETHPDICYDQRTGDIYLAWTRVICVAGVPRFVEARYARHDADYGDLVWLGPYSLEAGTNWGDFDPWYVSLDVGEVAFPDEDVERYVAFAYTGLFPVTSGWWWGSRPVVGWWSIENGPVDSAHAPIVRLIVPDYDPFDESYHKYDAGLIKVDIPGDNAPVNGGAVVFVQDTCDPAYGTYAVYGISSLSYVDPDWFYTWISDPAEEDFDEATLPSLAVHNSSGTTASVTFFGMNTGDPWRVWATHWDMEGEGAVSAPTDVDDTASGDFSLSVEDFMFHNWGTSSSLVDMEGYNNMYWAAWSDRIGGAATPNTVRGCVGFAKP
jgi:hypothetical protein